MMKSDVDEMDAGKDDWDLDGMMITAKISENVL